MTAVERARSIPFGVTNRTIAQIGLLLFGNIQENAIRSGEGRRLTYSECSKPLRRFRDAGPRIFLESAL